MTLVDVFEREANNRHTSLTDEWLTPTEIIEAARETMGGIDLDPASSAVANDTVKATSYFDSDDNGFVQPWKGRVFLNPPGGVCDAVGLRVVRGKKGEKGCTETGACGIAPGHKHLDPVSSASKAWWFRLATEFVAGHVTEAIFLGFSIEILQTTQVGETDLSIPLDFPLCFPSRRLAFIDETGSPVKGNTHASVIVHVRKPGMRGIDRFTPAFSKIGRCIG